MGGRDQRHHPEDTDVAGHLRDRRGSCASLRRGCLSFSAAPTRAPTSPASRRPTRRSPRGSAASSRHQEAEEK
ncbi:hypothetical protein HU200_040742 [Digitaria exilis]|uniref:Uncharacterized protein n=1 Tax=Digitaria exilis TaxID=1010633 RepID=A0A835BGJ2_9POAL|nr:hypothetical protein HU200_040742 [Digitaria exilis]